MSLCAVEGGSTGGGSCGDGLETAVERNAKVGVAAMFNVRDFSFGVSFGLGDTTMGEVALFCVGMFVCVHSSCLFRWFGSGVWVDVETEIFDLDRFGTTENEGWDVDRLFSSGVYEPGFGKGLVAGLGN